MPDELPDWLKRSFSTARMAPYLRAAAGDGTAAERLYWWNLEISEAFYRPLHFLEVALRNALHEQLAARYGRADWWAVAPLNPRGLRSVDEACRNQDRRKHRASQPDDVVAQLSFGFWVSLLSSGHAYDRLLWVPTLHRAFPYYSGPRRKLHDNLLSTVLLRNRVMHYEPIHHRDLAADHRKIYRLLGYISPDIAKSARANDRVSIVLALRDGT